MKILCVSDHIDPLVYTNNIKERFADADMVLAAGDLPLGYLDFIVSSLNVPVFFVFGNHNLEDLPYFRRNLDTYNALDEGGKMGGCGAIHLHGKIHREKRLFIAGLGGSMRYNKGENQYTDFQMYLEILKLFPAMLFNKILWGRWVDILLTHASPLGIHDQPDRCHQGFRAFLWFMRVFKPKYLVHGHIHLYDLSEVRTTRYHDTLVINAYSRYVIDTEAQNE